MKDAEEPMDVTDVTSQDKIVIMNNQAKEISTDKTGSPQTKEAISGCEVAESDIQHASAVPDHTIIDTPGKVSENLSNDEKFEDSSKNLKEVTGKPISIKQC